MEKRVEMGLETVKEYNDLIINYLNMMYRLEEKGISKQELEKYENAFETIVDKEKKQYQSLDDELIQDLLIDLNIDDEYEHFQKNGIIGKAIQAKRIEKILKETLWERELENETKGSCYQKEKIIKRIPLREINYNYQRNIQRIIDREEPGSDLREKSLKLKYRHKYYEMACNRTMLDYPTMQVPYRDYVRASKEEKAIVLDRLGLSKEEFIEAYQELGNRIIDKVVENLSALPRMKNQKWNLYGLDNVIVIQSLLPMLTLKSQSKLKNRISKMKPSRYTCSILKIIEGEKNEKKILGYYPIHRGIGDNHLGPLDEGR